MSEGLSDLIRSSHQKNSSGLTQQLYQVNPTQGCRREVLCCLFWCFCRFFSEKLQPFLLLITGKDQLKAKFTCACFLSHQMLSSIKTAWTHAVGKISVEDQIAEKDPGIRMWETDLSFLFLTGPFYKCQKATLRLSGVSFHLHHLKKKRSFWRFRPDTTALVCMYPPCQNYMSGVSADLYISSRSVTPTNFSQTPAWWFVSPFLLCRPHPATRRANDLAFVTNMWSHFDWIVYPALLLQWKPYLLHVTFHYPRTYLSVIKHTKQSIFHHQTSNFLFNCGVLNLI